MLTSWVECAATAMKPNIVIILADNFGVTFPADLDVTRKSLLLGAVFLIDFVHFERSGNQ